MACTQESDMPLSDQSELLAKQLTVPVEMQVVYLTNIIIIIICLLELGVGDALVTLNQLAPV
jgi:hypothetical protein